MKSLTDHLAQARQLPLIAILRGLDPGSAASIGSALFDSGFRILEVPLNRPGAVECIDILSRHLPSDALIGGGTVLAQDHVDAVYAAGGRLIVSPNCNPSVIAHAVARGMLCAPGIATPTEAFAALQAGAHALKVFPAEMVGHAGLKALKSVVPHGVDFWSVGGITPASMPLWMAAGATGFGIGSQLYAAGDTGAEVLRKGQLFVHAWREAKGA
jgi:2-dehydro-3-deoxyphosphogalactonate aldolase